MFCIGVYDVEKEKRKMMRERLIRYSLKRDRDFDILWLVDSSEEELEKYAFQMQLVFISLDSPASKSFGDTIYHFNPDCRICYYKSVKCDLEPLLSARPVAFYLWEDDGTETAQEAEIPNNPEDEFVDKLDGLLQEVLNSDDVFFYETRKTNYLLSIRNIEYFQSDLKYVEIHTHSEINYRIYAKLSEIEKKLIEDNLFDHFVRIHKSFIVNIAYIETLDKVNHMLFLSNKDNDSLPISDRYYGNVLKKLT